MKFHGVGHGSVKSKVSFSVPISIAGRSGVFEGQLMEGPGAEELPPLLSLQGIQR